MYRRGGGWPPDSVARIATWLWGQNDEIFSAAGAEPYKRDLKTLEFHLIDAGHFALESNGQEIAILMRHFLSKQLADCHEGGH